MCNYDRLNKILYANLILGTPVLLHNQSQVNIRIGVDAYPNLKV